MDIEDSREYGTVLYGGNVLGWVTAAIGIIIFAVVCIVIYFIYRSMSRLFGGGESGGGLFGAAGNVLNTGVNAVGGVFDGVGGLFSR